MARCGHYANPIKSATCDLPTVPRVWACKATFCSGVQDEGDKTVARTPRMAQKYPVVGVAVWITANYRLHGISSVSGAQGLTKGRPGLARAQIGNGLERKAKSKAVTLSGVLGRSRTRRARVGFGGWQVARAAKVSPSREACP